jgi:minor histocompatibility antigen H13
MAARKNDLLTLAYCLLVGFWAISYFIVLPIPVNLIVTSTAIIYIGSHRSLTLLLSEAEGGLSHDEKEVLSAKDAYKFPIIGSLSLFGLYLAFKFFDKNSINLILSLYFSLIGVFTLTNTFSKFLSQFLTNPKKHGWKSANPLPIIGEVDLTFTLAEGICFIFSVVFSYQYFHTKHYMMNNIFGISLCIQAIEKISLGNYKVGGILLIGLFFYDIFWVFGTDVMVTVAKSFDGPIKLLFPRKLPSLDSKGEFSLLGLGDIVIPGLFVALLLRFDLSRTPNLPDPLKNIDQILFDKTYFHTNILAYAAGLVATVGVMFYFSAAQPALLYLVPACLGASILTAILRGEVSKLFEYNEEKLKHHDNPSESTAAPSAVTETQGKEIKNDEKNNSSSVENNKKDN